MKTYVLLMTVLLLAACSAPGPATQTDANLNYLEGIETDYSMRLEDLPGSDTLDPDTAMREALIAGDGDVFVAAALFQRGRYVTMDLIVLNHTEDIVHIERGDLRIVDHEGHWLSPVQDWNGAEDHGLRAKSYRSVQPMPYDTTSDLSGTFFDPSAMESAGAARKAIRQPSANRIPRNARQVDTAWHNGSDGEAANTPQEVDIPGREGGTYWAYWEAEDVSYPLTAFVMLEGRHMVFRFQK